MADKETILGPETRISGEIRGDEDLVVRGRVDGKVQLSQTLTVDKGAIVQADVDVRTLVVAGTLVGSVVASESVRLLATARVVGDLAAPRVTMEAGAAYRGRVDMGDIEAARAAVASRPATKPAAHSTSRPVETSRAAPPRMVAPPRTVSAPAAKVAPKPAAPSAERPAPAAPPAFPRVAGSAASGAPAWAKKKIRRR